MLSAFTLSEVLVTLTILGILASIIVPNVVQRYQDRQTITSVKKTYAILDNAFQLAIVEKGKVSSWDFPSASGGKTNAIFIAKTLQQYIKTSDYCEKRDSKPSCYSNLFSIDKSWKNTECFYYKSLNPDVKTILFSGSSGTSIAERPAFRLPNGASVGFKNAYTTNNTCDEDGNKYLGDIFVDINGPKGPNRLGYDAFLFAYGDRGLMIDLENNTGSTNAFLRRTCHGPSGQYSDGQSCGRYIMLFNKVDYKYKDVSSKWPQGSWWDCPGRN